MTLIGWKSSQILGILHQQIQQLLKELLRNSNESTVWVGSMGSTHVSDLEIEETNTDIILNARIPGIQAESLEVEVTQETVVIRGEREQAEVEGYFGAGRFQNIIPFPSPTHPEAVRAELKGDILTLMLPKLGTTQRKGVRMVVCNRALVPEPQQFFGVENYQMQE